MRKLLAVYMPVVMIGWFAAPAPARAQSELPPDRSVTYNVHTDNTDPESPILISTEVRLRAVSRDGDVVGWNPIWVVVSQYDEGRLIDSWTDYDPAFPDEEPWYVTHADPLAPTSAEFARPPELAGTAESDTPNGPTMDYFLLGKNAGTPPESPYPITSMLDYSFQRSDEPEPVDEDEDGPAETPPEPEEED